MTKRYRLLLQVDNDEGVNLVNLHVTGKLMETVQQLIRLSMGDFEKVDKPTPKNYTPVKVEPPIEPMDKPMDWPPLTPTPDDVKDV